MSLTQDETDDLLDIVRTDSGNTVFTYSTVTGKLIAYSRPGVSLALFYNPDGTLYRSTKTTDTITVTKQFTWTNGKLTGISII